MDTLAPKLGKISPTKPIVIPKFPLELAVQFLTTWLAPKTTPKLKTTGAPGTLKVDRWKFKSPGAAIAELKKPNGSIKGSAYENHPAVVKFRSTLAPKKPVASTAPKSNTDPMVVKAFKPISENKAAK